MLIRSWLGHQGENEKESNLKRKYPRVFRGTVENISKLTTNTQTVFCKPQYKLSVVIPAYNEEKRLEFMINDAFKSLVQKIESDPKFNCEIILVDDGSKDETIKEYRRIISTFLKISKIDFKLLKLGTNSGKGKAVSEVLGIQSFYTCIIVSLLGYIGQFG